MSVQRNAPCPCGSGKKYKQCCMRKDRRQGAFQQVVEQAQAGPDGSVGLDSKVWQIDLAAVPVRIKNDPTVRPALIIIAAGGEPIHTELLAHPPSEPEAVADLFVAALKEFGVEDHRPEVIEMRYEDIAELVRPAFEGAGIEVAVEPILEDVDDLLMDLREAQGLKRSRHAPSIPDTWAAWGLPEPLVAELFEAAADYYRVAPWRLVGNEQVLNIEMDRGAEWTVTVMGGAGEAVGIALYQDVRDLWQLYDDPIVDTSFTRFCGGMMSLLFVHGKEVPAKTRQEVRRKGWPLAGLGAYPDLVVMNTPGSGVSQAQFGDLISLLHAIPAFVEQHADRLKERRPLKEAILWRDPEQGLTISCANSLYPEGEAFTDPPAILAPCLPEGPAADPEARIPEPDPTAGPFAETGEVWSSRGFERWLAGRKLSRASRRSTIDAAESFIFSFLGNDQGVLVNAVTEYDLRLFLHEWFPRKAHMDDKLAEALPAQMELLFEYLAEEEGIVCPWVSIVLSPEERDCFSRRWRSCPGSFFWDDGVAVWRRQAHQDLRERLLLPTRDLAEDLRGGEVGQGIEEAMLSLEMERRWLIWRDALIESGVTEASAMRAALEERLKAWEATPQDALSGKTPLKVIKAERRRMARLGLHRL